MAKAFIYKAPKVKVREFFVFYFREARCSVSLFRVLKIALLCHERFSWSLPDERCLYSMRPENTRALVLYFQPLTPWQNQKKKAQKNVDSFLPSTPLHTPTWHARATAETNETRRQVCLCCRSIADPKSYTWTSVLHIQIGGRESNCFLKRLDIKC